ncbi:hypothetical protein [Bradyrhizobium sp. SSUT77]|uniref:hypothetical protein n=1 Tax=Bradyrhizobium sp. SSUT77 TaxID=3040603 RepID=UPI002448BBB4|nr:hypothetical protein [Bradyrhizobium sp. SSUT77]MDH2347457.1 hypothetical protein [Bradyrhizobium sp. SSUT77]
MRLLDIGFAFAVAGAVWLRWQSDGSVDVKTSYYWTMADTVICETPFQIRKAIVAMAQDDGAGIRSLACTRPGAGKRVRVVSMPATTYGPWEIQLISERGAAATMWGYADQFEADRDQ